MARIRFALLTVGLACLWFSPDGQAQGRYHRYYIRQVHPSAPATARPQSLPNSQRQGQASTSAPPASATSPYRIVYLTPPKPEDVEKVKAEQDARVQRTIEWQKMRAEGGSPTSQYDLGMRYLRGDGVEPDLQLSHKWLEQAAKNGHDRAAWELSKLKREQSGPLGEGSAKTKERDSEAKPDSAADASKDKEAVPSVQATPMPE